MALDAKGRFDGRVPAAAKLVLHLVDRSGAHTYWVRNVRASAPANKATGQRIARRRPGSKTSNTPGRAASTAR
jgi:hypothetical protein